MNGFISLIIHLLFNDFSFAVHNQQIILNFTRSLKHLHSAVSNTRAIHYFDNLLRFMYAQCWLPVKIHQSCFHLFSIELKNEITFSSDERIHIGPENECHADDDRFTQNRTIMKWKFKDQTPKSKMALLEDSKFEYIPYTYSKIKNRCSL